jgi:Ca2+-transporting ATPase
MIPVFEHGAQSIEDIARIMSESHEVLMQSQTAAFCVLSLSELFHMLGMTSIRKSFVHNFYSKNWLLWVSFTVGIALQIAVVNIPGLNSFFDCFPLDIWHWGIIFALSVAPLVVHEIVALVLFIKRKIQKQH